MSKDRREDVNVLAAAIGCKAITPNVDDIFLDFDHPDEDFKQLDAMLPLLADRGLDPKVLVVTESLHRKAHVYLRVSRPLTETERLVIQATCGSDRKRELLSLFRVWDGVEPVGALFETQEEFERVQEAMHDPSIPKELRL